MVTSLKIAFWGCYLYNPWNRPALIWAVFLNWPDHCMYIIYIYILYVCVCVCVCVFVSAMPETKQLSIISGTFCLYGIDYDDDS